MINRQKELALVIRIIETCEVYTAYDATLSYGDLAHEIGLVPRTVRWDAAKQSNLLTPLLRQVAAFERAAGRDYRPLLRCVVNKKTGEPGGGLETPTMFPEKFSIAG